MAFRKLVPIIAIIAILLVSATAFAMNTGGNRGGGERGGGERDFGGSNDGTIIILNPIKTSSWNAGTEQKIVWRYSGVSPDQPIQIELLRDYASIITIASSVAIDKREFLWTIPGNVLPGSYVIRISSMEHRASAALSDEFKIISVAPPTQ